MWISPRSIAFMWNLMSIRVGERAFAQQIREAHRVGKIVEWAILRSPLRSARSCASSPKPGGRSWPILPLILALFAGPGFAQSDSPLGWDPYVTFAGNFDAGYHKTQFFENNHNVLVG